MFDEEMVLNSWTKDAEPTRKGEMCGLKRVIIERLSSEGHATLETDFENAVVLLADDLARGYMVFDKTAQQRLIREEELRSLGDSEEDTIRLMVIPPVAGG